MRLLFGTFLMLIVAVALALIAHADPGYVLIQYRGWTLEASLALLVAALALSFVLLYYLLRLIVNAFRMPERISAWRRRRAERRYQAALTRGTLDLLAGEWERAEKRLTRYSGRGHDDVLHYLGAARAAQQLGARARRDRYLQLAFESMPAAELPVALTQAELQFAQGQYEEALAILTRLQLLAPKNPAVLEQLMRLYLELRDWEHLLQLLPALRRRRVIERERAERLEEQACTGLLAKAGGESDARALQEAWQRVPRSMRFHEPVVREYVHQQVRRGATVEAEAALREALERRWSEALAHLYGLVESDAAVQLRRAEQWLEVHPASAALRLTAGRLSKRNGLWGKARRYLETCVRQAPTPEAFNELAGVLEQMGEREAAIRHYRQGLAALEDAVRRSALEGRPGARAGGGALLPLRS